jgi:hypothetical protein
VNRAFPARLSRSLLLFFQPRVTGICGFPAVYHRRYNSALERLLDAHGFEIEETIASYYQSSYYSFFLPLYLLSALYELGARASRSRNLAAYLLVVARKR